MSWPTAARSSPQPGMAAGRRPAGPAGGPGPPTTGTSAALAVGGAIATTVANFGIALVVARAGASFAGIFFAATAVLAIAGNSAAAGTMTGLVYFMPVALERPDPNPRSLLVIALRPVAFLGGLGGLLLAVTAVPLAGTIAAQRSSEAALLIAVLAPAVPAWAATACLLGAARGLGSVGPTVVINQIAKPLAQLVAVAAVVGRSGGPSMTAVGLAWTGPVVASTVLAAGAVWRLGGFTGSGPVPVEASRFWAYARPRALSTVFQIALERLDVILVSTLAGEAAAGVYGTISRYVTAGNYVVFSVAQATSADLRRTLISDRRDDARRLLQQVTGWMVLLSWPYFLLVATKAESLISLLNPDFTSGAAALSLLALALLANAFAGPVDLALLMLGRSKAALAVSGVAVAVDLALAWLLVPRLGIVGAAVAWGAAVVVQNGAAAVLVDRVGDLRGPGRPAVTAALGATAAVVPVAVLTPQGPMALVVCVVAAGLVLGPWVLRFAPALGLPVDFPGGRRRPGRSGSGGCGIESSEGPGERCNRGR